MYEVVVHSKCCEEVKLPEANLFVVVSDIKSDTLKDFMEQCQKIIKTGQPFLPIVVDSYGGQVYTLLGMVDFLNQCRAKVKVVTVCESKAMSAGALLFSCGEERYIGKNATIMIHEIRSWFAGKHIDLQNEAKEIARLNNRIFGLLDSHTGKPKGFWWDALGKNKHSDVFLNATQAKKNTLATHIGIPYIETSIEINRSLKLS